MSQKPPTNFKLVLGTNHWSHHQTPLCQALAERLGPDRFQLALFGAVTDERIKMGWDSPSAPPSWVMGPPSSDTELAAISQACVDADVMVLGDCPMEVLDRRSAQGKLTLVASERMLKKSHHSLRLLNPRYALGIHRFRKRSRHNAAHALAIGYHAPGDLRLIGAFGERIWRWGYFVEVSAVSPVSRPNRPLEILWAGRHLPWKRVDLILRALAEARMHQTFGLCRIVGDGPEKARTMALAKQLGLDHGAVSFEPSVSPQEIRRLMRESDVYILASNRLEGWGAVAGEAVSEGCILVGNEQAGASLDLIEDGVTGRIFKDGDSQGLARILLELSTEYTTREAMRLDAWRRLCERWHPVVAARQLVHLSEFLLGLRPDEPTGTPLCSRIRREGNLEESRSQPANRALLP